MKIEKEKAPLCKCGRRMVKNRGNIDMWICPSRNRKAKTNQIKDNPYQKSIKLYHGTKRENLKSILKDGLKRFGRVDGEWKGDSTYIYATPDIEIAKKFGDVVLQIEGKGLDLRVWDDEIDSQQIMVMGDIPPSRIKVLE